MILVWSYVGSILMLSERWLTEPDYSHGFVVPLFSIYLLWRRRDLLRQTSTITWSAVLTGCGLILAAGVMRWIGIYQQFDLLEPASLIPCLMGAFLIIGGWSWGKWSWPAVCFLVFMIPLPGFISGLLSQPLQRIGTIVSTFSLQTLGIPAIARGNVIYLTEARIGVVEACSGLRMLNVFFAITIAASFILNRPNWEKAVLILSAPLIGVVTNVMRITITGVAHEFFSRELADHLFHDLAGLLMMPIAVALLVLEAWLLKSLWLEGKAGRVNLGLGERKRLKTGDAT
ncbi:membrane protein, putative [Blastopirellula marina DSM 3645]|uniref:Membrane protein, putative n=2 Tax=Blastopirellula marina TaxID=124 RepID=A3ZP76_9BACT|nr:membrane protein, putative [Blastopirellula marina DSM 3645]